MADIPYAAKFRGAHAAEGAEETLVRHVAFLADTKDTDAHSREALARRYWLSLHLPDGNDSVLANRARDAVPARAHASIEAVRSALFGAVGSGAGVGVPRASMRTQLMVGGRLSGAPEHAHVERSTCASAAPRGGSSGRSGTAGGATRRWTRGGLTTRAAVASIVARAARSSAAGTRSAPAAEPDGQVLGHPGGPPRKQ